MTLRRLIEAIEDGMAGEVMDVRSLVDVMCARAVDGALGAVKNGRTDSEIVDMAVVAAKDFLGKTGLSTMMYPLAAVSGQPLGSMVENVFDARIAFKSRQVELPDRTGLVVVTGAVRSSWPAPENGVGRVGIVACIVPAISDWMQQPVSLMVDFASAAFDVPGR
jgi:hypothetical protein